MNSEPACDRMFYCMLSGFGGRAEVFSERTSQRWLGYRGGPHRNGRRTHPPHSPCLDHTAAETGRGGERQGEAGRDAVGAVGRGEAERGGLGQQSVDWLASAPRSAIAVLSADSHTDRTTARGGREGSPDRRLHAVSAAGGGGCLLLAAASAAAARGEVAHRNRAGHTTDWVCRRYGCRVATSHGRS